MSAPLSPDLRGAALMTAAMAGFAIEDLFIKRAALSLPVGQVMVLMGFSGALVFALMARARGEAALPRVFLSRPMLIRSGFEISGRLFYSLALALTPMSATVAILQATPLVVLAGAALIFGEQVGWRRWSAVIVGFIGVLIVLRPGAEGFSALSLLAVAGMLGFAGRDLATRAAPQSMSNRQLGTLGFAMLGFAGVIVLGFTGEAHIPDLREAGLVLGATVFGVAAYNALTAAMRTGDVSAVTPFRYTRLIFAMILAVLILGESPDAATILGSAIIVVSGLYTLLRARRKALR
ncbi:DMT family transporter [Pseudogemmobacter humi]|uniref:EamA-like transporter family protein n=1 Tax=Pseudogemmobacter humi TaxID=2483812 RepID=A0A3P5WRI5_9RHOB|nr:DMT family transporter [Pseudogemmobacter humi]VDC21236.1 EamA-like transporter family protein [Pseudogemmobacter humi]